MSFIFRCTNKSCLKEMAPVIDKKDNKAYCTECESEIKEIDPFMKNQLIHMGQIKKEIQKKMAWAIKCASCNKENVPVTKNNQFFCPFCQEKINISPMFAHSLKGKVQKANF